MVRLDGQVVAGDDEEPRLVEVRQDVGRLIDEQLVGSDGPQHVLVDQRGRVTHLLGQDLVSTAREQRRESGSHGVGVAREADEAFEHLTVHVWIACDLDGSEADPGLDRSRMASCQAHADSAAHRVSDVREVLDPKSLDDLPRVVGHA